jgi:hypothetical protein
MNTKSGKVGNRSMVCACGSLAVRLKENEPICRRCDELERRGFVGGPINQAVDKVAQLFTPGERRLRCC